MIRRTACFLILLTLGAVAAAADRPNIVFLMFDDLGWADIGVQGNGYVETPHIDELAAKGIRFTQFYAASPVCSPTRASIQSGQNPARFGLTDFIPGYRRPYESLITPRTAPHLPHDLTTLGEALQQVGYRTGYFGKWHLGNDPADQPGVRGYEVAKVTPLAHRTPNGQWATEEMAEDFASFAASNDGARPFFAFVSPYVPHIPLLAPASMVKHYREKAVDNGAAQDPIYAAMIEQGDVLLGAVSKTLEELDIEDDTIVIFTSDNGGLMHMDLGMAGLVTSNAPLRGEKGTVLEGGIRVPLIIRAPGQDTAGTTTDQLAISYDFYPTLLEWAGGTPAITQSLDGVSLVPIVSGARHRIPRDPFHFYYPHYHHGVPAHAMRDGDWKLIEYFDGTPPELYNLERDISEQHNLAAEAGQRLARMSEAMEQWRIRTSVSTPSANPDADPARADEWWTVVPDAPVDMERFRSFFSKPTELPE